LTCSILISILYTLWLAMDTMNYQILLDHSNAEKILEESWRLFQQRGYRGVTIDELCLRCQLSKPTLYYYFKDKETLFVQVLQYKLSGFRAAAQRPGSLHERLCTVATTLLTSFEKEYSPLLRDREHIKKPDNLKKIRDAFHDGLFDPLTTIMQSGIDSGELIEESPVTLTLIFLGTINFFIGRSDELQVDHTVLARKLTEYFLKGVKI
jgi:TetR/AcrR family transcriptional regulator